MVIARRPKLRSRMPARSWTVLLTTTLPAGTSSPPRKGTGLSKGRCRAIIATKEGDRVEQRTMPGIHCPNDGTPMYLAEINPEHKSYRLWKCPQCRKSVTNLESMQARGQSA